MQLFRRKPPPKQKPRKSHLPQTLDQALERELIKRARRDPEWAFRAAKQKFALELPEDRDPVAGIRQRALAEALENDPEFVEQVKREYLESTGSSLEGDELERRISVAAIEELDSNPELLRKAVRRRVDSIVSDHSDGSGVSDLLNQLKGLRELEEEVGGGKKFGGLIDASVIKEVVGILPALMGRNTSSERTYVVETPEGFREMTVDQYKSFLEQKSRPQLPAASSQGAATLEVLPEQALEQALEEPLTEIQDTGDVLDTGEDVPNIQASEDNIIGLQDWLPYLDKEPEEFARVLTSLSQRNGSEGHAAIFTISLLRTNTVDMLLVLLNQYRFQPEYAEAVGKIESHREWLEGLVKCFQGTPT